MDKRSLEIINYVRVKERAQSSAVHAHLKATGDDFSLVSVKRALSHLRSAGILKEQGAGPATFYTLSEYGKLIAPVDAAAYNTIDPDKRHGAKSYNFELFPSLTFGLFSAEEKRVFGRGDKVLQRPAYRRFGNNPQKRIGALCNRTFVEIIQNRRQYIYASGY